MKLKITNARLSFPNLFKRASFQGEEGKYGCTLLIAKDDPQIGKIKDAIGTLVANELKGAKLGPDKLCLRDGDESEYDGYAGHYSLKASLDQRPTVIDRDKSPLTADDGVPYAGCYVNASVTLWAQSNSWGKRINASLGGVQFVKDGTPFSGSRAASVDEFDEVEWEDDGSDGF